MTDSSTAGGNAERRGMFGVIGSGDTSGYGRLVRPIALPNATQPPYGGWFDEAIERLTTVLPDYGCRADAAIEQVVIFRDELTVHIAREYLPTVALALRNDPQLRFELCLGVNGVHYPEQTGRELHAVYPLVSITHNRRLRLEVSVGDDDLLDRRLGREPRIGQGELELLGHGVEVAAVGLLAGPGHLDRAHEPAEARGVTRARHAEGALTHAHGVGDRVQAEVDGPDRDHLAAVAHRSSPRISMVAGAVRAALSSSVIWRCRFDPSLVFWTWSWSFTIASISISGRGGQPGR